MGSVIFQKEIFLHRRVVAVQDSPRVLQKTRGGGGLPLGYPIHLGSRRRGGGRLFSYKEDVQDVQDCQRMCRISPIPQDMEKERGVDLHFCPPGPYTPPIWPRSISSFQGEQGLGTSRSHLCNFRDLIIKMRHTNKARGVVMFVDEDNLKRFLKILKRLMHSGENPELKNYFW